MYQIRDETGAVRFETPHSNSANGYYQTVRNETGYAEIWYDGKCIFKTR